MLRIDANLAEGAEGSVQSGTGVFLITSVTWALLSPLSSSLDYGHLLNYFLETNLFFNLRQMAIWPPL